MVTALIAFLLLGVLLTILLYVVIKSETTNTQILDREAAEEEAKRRGGIDRTDRVGPETSRESDLADARERDDSW